MRRRELVAALFASSLPMPLAAQSRAGRIGYLALLHNERLFNALVRGLGDNGLVLNANVVIDARSAEGDPTRLEEAAAARSNTGSAGRDRDDSHRFRAERRCSRDRHGRESRPAWRQPDGPKPG